MEINKLDEVKLNRLFNTNKKLNRYKPIFDRLRTMRPHQLSEQLEHYIHDLSTVGSSSWNRLFDETISGLEFKVSNETMGIESTLNLLTDTDREKRKSASLIIIYSNIVNYFFN